MDYLELIKMLGDGDLFKENKSKITVDDFNSILEKDWFMLLKTNNNIFPYFLKTIYANKKNVIRILKAYPHLKIYMK
jgi:hypothetical protein